MRMTSKALKQALVATSAIVGFAVAAEQASAGGFAIREQSAQFQGSSFAGAAAGGGLSSMYWNPAAVGQAGSGLTSESHFAGIFGQAVNTVESIDPGIGALPPGAVFPGAPVSSGDIASPALLGASYYAYRLSERLTLGLSLTSGFGLTTKPRDFNYAGAELGRTTKLFTMNAAPTLAYQIAPGITVGAGVQVQYARAKLAFGVPGVPASNAVYRDADDIALGYTAGILLQPTAGTSIGLGYRSQLTQELEGDFVTARGVVPNAQADLELPGILTLSLRQDIAPNMRLLGTVEWTDWSRFKQLVLTPVGLTIPANWSDGWFFSVGGEYDLNPGLTLRAGIGYEISPVDDPTKRFTSIPDNDRVWLSGGGTVKISDKISADFSYTHVFVETGDFQRTGPGSGFVYTGQSEAQVDIFSVSMKTRWGGEAPLEPMK